MSIPPAFSHASDNLFQIFQNLSQKTRVSVGPGDDREDQAITIPALETAPGAPATLPQETF